MPAEQRRDQLLDAALTIIARDGYSAVTVEAIAREIDVTRPVVYNVFDGLEELLRALLDRQQQRALDQLLRTISVPPSGPDAAAGLTRTVKDLITMVRDDPLTWTPILLSSPDTPAVVRDRIDHDRELVRGRIESLVALAVAARPKAAARIDARIASHAFIALAEYFGRMILLRPGDVDDDRLAATVTALVLT